MLRLRTLLAGMCIAVLCGSGLSGDDTKPDKVKGTLPSGWKKLNLTKAQVEKIYTIQGNYRKQIADLQKQIADLQKKQRSEMIGVLTKEQKDQLTAEFKEKDKAIKDKN
jgi:Spy/CpxP family protein refolding chaperone